mmetsp:Transcript_37621/g.86909  ORF Transcript_37621/g.86909 Transcript_37621/m.86909 type:complete len:219 (+) Transcript_37621:2226-2882(+)
MKANGPSLCLSLWSYSLKTLEATPLSITGLASCIVLSESPRAAKPWGRQVIIAGRSCISCLNRGITAVISLVSTPLMSTTRHPGLIPCFRHILSFELSFMILGGISSLLSASSSICGPFKSLTWTSILSFFRKTSFKGLIFSLSHVSTNSWAFAGLQVTVCSCFSSRFLAAISQSPMPTPLAATGPFSLQAVIMGGKLVLSSAWKAIFAGWLPRTIST